jgi:hypothetical protein
MARADAAARRAEVDAVLSRARDLAASFASLARSYEDERSAAASVGLDRGLPLYDQGLGLLRGCCGQLAASGLIGALFFLGGEGGGCLRAAAPPVTCGCSHRAAFTTAYVKTITRMQPQIATPCRPTGYPPATTRAALGR